MSFSGKNNIGQRQEVCRREEQVEILQCLGLLQVVR